MYHNYVGKVTWWGIFWWFYWSPSLLLCHSPYFFKWVWPPFHNLECCVHIFWMLDTNCSCICHLFPTSLTFYSFGRHSTCWNYHFPIPYGITRYMGHISLGCPFSGTTLWDLIVYFYPQLQVYLVDHLHQ